MTEQNNMILHKDGTPILNRRVRYNRPKKNIVPYNWVYLHPKYGRVRFAKGNASEREKSLYKIGLSFRSLRRRKNNAIVGYSTDQHRFTVEGFNKKIPRKFRAGWRYVEYYQYNERLYKLKKVR